MNYGRLMSLDAKFWLGEIDAYKSYVEDWEKCADKVVERYREEKRNNRSRSRFNILWSNIKTLKPAVYSRRPVPEVSRRHKDKDPVGRVASELLERALVFESEHYSDVHNAINLAVDDELLAGRGTIWARFDARIDLQTQGSEGDPPPDGEESTDVKAAPEEQITRERAAVDYVYRKDFAHSPGRCWDEVRWVARRTYLTRDKLLDRFGDKAKDTPLAHEPEGYSKEALDSRGEDLKQAIVWEIWHKDTQKVYWVAEMAKDSPATSKPELLDERDDFLNLDGFWPCPKPLSMSMDAGKMIPVPDYEHYKDQAEELDTLTHRITKIQDAIRANAIYPSDSKKELSGLMSKENTMIPVDSWAAFAEKGGVQGMIQWVPVDMLAQVLTILQQQRESVKQTVYELTGLSDIVRGASNAQETATAQRIKGQFASLRLTDRQNAVAEFASHAFRIKAEIMATKYQPATLVEMSNIADFVGYKPVEPRQARSQEEAAAIQKEQQEMQQKGQLIGDALKLLQSEPGRQFHIAVNADSFVQLDEDAEKEAATEFLGAVGSFMQQALPLAQAMPQMGPMVGEMIMFAARNFKAGRQLEPIIEEAMGNLQGPNPQQAMAQVEQERQKLEQEGQRMQEDQRRAMEQIGQEREMGKRELQTAQKELVIAKREAGLQVKEFIANDKLGLAA